MKELLSKRVISLAPSGIRRFFDIVSDIPDAVSLGVGEPDFDTPWHIREEGIRTLKDGKTFYSSNAGTPELRRAISDYLKRSLLNTYDWQHEILVTVGGSEAIDIALRTILNDGDEVICPEPCFVSYIPCIIMANGVPVRIPLRAENEFRLTRAELEAAVTSKTKALLISFPNNPTGAVMGRSDLEAVAEVAREHNLIVISDEIYSELTYGGPHTSIASLPGMRDRTIVINGFSKAYAMTGWRLGYAAANHEIMEQMLKLHQFAIMCAPTVGQYAAVAALTNGDEDVAEMRISYNQRRNYLHHELQRLNLPCFKPQGAFYMFPCIREFGMTSEEFALKLLETEKLAVVPGSAFGESGEGYLRLSYAYSIQELKEAVNRLENFITRLRG